MLIWVAGLDKQLLGYMSPVDFGVMTGNLELVRQREGKTVNDGVEIYRTAQYIFGTLSVSNYRPSLCWSIQDQRVEPIHKTMKT
jgi:hypothetical protein